MVHNQMKTLIADTISAQHVSQKDTLIKNCFFLWSHGLVLLLSMIPVSSYFVSKVFDIPVWTVPKIYELKMYALGMVGCLAMPFLNRYAPSLLLRDHPRYQLFFLLFYPAAVLIYSQALPDFVRYSSVLAFAFIGVAVLIYDMRHPAIIHRSYLSRHYDKLLIATISFSILLIICKSDAMMFNLFSTLALTAFISVFLIVRFATVQDKYFIFLVPVFLFMVTFGSMQGAIEVTHYSFLLGPVIEVLYGHFHPLNLDIQYGGGLTTFLALYFKARGLVSFEGMQDLLKFLAFMQYLLVYFIATSLYRSQKIAFMTLLAILAFNFFAPNINYYYCAPSTGFLRFGFIYLILLCYLLQNKIFSARSTVLIISILGSIAVLWSFESAVYTLPALFFAEYIDNNLKKFLPVFLGCFCIIGLAYLSPFFMQGHWPPLWRYYEYAMVYANGFGQIPLDRLTSFWWLFPLLYGFFLIKIITGNISNKLISALTIYGMAIFSYFAGRSHPIGIFVVSIPFILLSIYFILNLRSPSVLIKQILLAFALIVFPSAYYVIDSKRIIIQGVWEVNSSLVKNFLLFSPAPPFLISDSGSPWMNKASDNIVEIGCSVYSPLKKYIENNSIAILSTDDKNLIRFYACTKSHNALAINPYYETAFNSKAVARTIKKASTLANHYILVESNLLKSQYDPWGSEMTLIILRHLHAKKVDKLTLAGEAMDVFQTQLNKQ
jgi:hypothetical protein